MGEISHDLQGQKQQQQQEDGIKDKAHTEVITSTEFVISALKLC